MAHKKNYRADNTYLISNDSTDNPKLGAKVLNDGKESLYLDFYLGYTIATSNKSGKEYKRVNIKRESLHLYLWQAPRTPLEREHNRETLELAKRIRFERGQQLLEDREGYRLKRERQINFLDYFQSYIENYTKKDKRMVKLAFCRFKDFLNDTPEYNKYVKSIKPEQISKDMVVAYTEYLQSRGTGEGPKSIYARFKKVVNYATEHDMFRKNPCNGVVIKVDEQTLRKEVLSPDEIRQLIACNNENHNQEVRRAFLLSLYCGLRYCDVKDLTFANVDYSNRLLKFEQNKTKGHSATSGVVIDLSDDILELIGKPSTDLNKDSLIFNLPSYTMCIKSIERWVKRAGIYKHITWHCARHSFAVNVLNSGANIKTVASLLGHSGLKHTEKYTRAVDSLKKEAMTKLTELYSPKTDEK